MLDLVALNVHCNSGLIHTSSQPDSWLELTLNKKAYGENATIFYCLPARQLHAIR